MEPIRDLSAPQHGSTVCCAVAAYSVLEATADRLQTLRQSPGPMPGEPLPASFLKHADGQTIAGLAAVLAAVERHGLAVTCLTDWAVLAAPRHLARVALAHAINRFALEGAWGVSPHIIPHLALHSVSGTVSQALKIHGPNFGVGGGPWGAAKAILAAAALLQDGRVPGAWVVMTGWDCEPGLQETTSSADVAPEKESGACKAVAIALLPENGSRQGLRLQVSPDDFTGGQAPDDAPLLTLETLAASLTSAPELAFSWQLGCGGRLKLEQIDGTVAKRETERQTEMRSPRHAA